MKDIAIYGAGGFGREIACLINKINKVEPTWNIIGFFDDGLPLEMQISHFGKILGGISQLNEYKKPLSVVIAIGNQNTLRKIAESITNSLIEFPNIISPNVTFGDLDTFEIGYGNIIQDKCAFSCNVKIGNYNVFNGDVAFGHDDVIGNYNSFMPSVRVSGNVHLADNNFFGVGSIIIQGLRIGSNVKLGAGGVLLTKPKEHSLYLGNPAKLVKL